MQAIECKTGWSHPPDDLELQPDRVDIWRIPLDLPAALVKRLEASLSANEARRAARFRFPADRQRYIAAHGGLRDILARYLRCEPGGLTFSTNQYGKPSVPGHNLEFSLSHSGDFGLMAVTKNRRIGIDVEQIRFEMEFERIAKRYFSPNEVSELAALPPAARQAAFFDCWTRKEAYIKAHGLGLSLPLNSFDVSLTPGAPAVLHATRPDPGEANRWALHVLDVDPAYRAAVAVENAALRQAQGGDPSSSPGSVKRLPKRESLAFRFWNWKITHNV